jgi:hypothetical protein
MPSKKLRTDYWRNFLKQQIKGAGAFIQHPLLIVYLTERGTHLDAEIERYDLRMHKA